MDTPKRVLIAMFVVLTLPSLGEDSTADSNCQVTVLVGHSQQASFRCQEEYESPPESVAWMEFDGRITPFLLPSDELLGAGRKVPLLVPKGLVAVECSLLPEWKRIELIDVTKRQRFSEGERIFRRTIVNTKLPVTMPEGEVVGVVFDSRDNLVAISAPTKVNGGDQTIVTFPHRAGVGPLVVELSTGNQSVSGNEHMSVTQSARYLAPDVFVSRGRTIFGIWYSPIAEGMLALSSTKWFFPPRMVVGTDAAIFFIREEVKAKPTLHITVDTVPALLSDQSLEKAIITVYDAGDRHVLEALEHVGELGEPLWQDVVDLTQPKIEQVISHVLPTIVIVTVTAGDAKLTAVGDTRRGDATVAFELRPIMISGTVTRGGEPVPVRIVFRRKGNSIESRSDDGGKYLVRLWEPGRYIAEIYGSESAAPYSDLLRLGHTQNIDFALEEANFSIRVLDLETDTPVSEPVANFVNAWEDSELGRQRVVQRVHGDESGIISLPSLRPGNLEVTVYAEGFLPSRRLVVEVNEGSDETRAEVRLRRAEGKRLRVILPDGTPAKSAEVAGYNPFSEDILWRSSTDDEGIATIPQSPANAWVLIRHPNAASLVGSFDLEDGLQTDVVLGKAAPPLTIQAMRGETALRKSAVAVWLNNRRMSGAGLGFLTSSDLMVDSRGLWRAFNLPRNSIRILVSPDKHRLNEGLLDVFSTRIDFPWIGIVPVQGVE